MTACFYTCPRGECSLVKPGYCTSCKQASYLLQDWTPWAKQKLRASVATLKVARHLVKASTSSQKRWHFKDLQQERKYTQDVGVYHHSPISASLTLVYAYSKGQCQIIMKMLYHYYCYSSMWWLNHDYAETLVVNKEEGTQEQFASGLCLYSYLG